MAHSLHGLSWATLIQINPTKFPPSAPPRAHGRRRASQEQRATTPDDGTMMHLLLSAVAAVVPSSCSIAARQGSSCVTFDLSQLPTAAWVLRDSTLPRTCFAATPCHTISAAQTNCTSVVGAHTAPAFQQGQHPSGKCYALGSLATQAATVIDERNASAGLLLTYSGGAGGRVVRYRLVCDPSVPADAGPTEEIPHTMTYEVLWRTPHACTAVPAPASACPARPPPPPPRPPPPPPPPQRGPVAVPSAAQLAWQDLEVSAMLGWNLQTLCTVNQGAGHSTQHCQAAGFVPTREQVAAWNPHNTDTDAWAKVAASFGAKYMVIVADHMTGFTWWDTKFHNYSIAHTQYKGGGTIQLKAIITCRISTNTGVSQSLLKCFC